MSSDLDPADIDEYISYFQEHLEQISSSKKLQEAYDEVCRKGALVKGAAKESQNDRKALDPLLCSFTASYRWLVNELRGVEDLEDAVEGQKSSDKGAQEKSSK